MLVVHFEIADGARGDIENDLTVGNEILGYFYPGIMGVYHNIRRTIVVHYPVKESSKQVGSIGPHLHVCQLGANFALKIGQTLLERWALKQTIHIIQ